MSNKKVTKIYEAGLHLIPTIEKDKVSGVFEEIKKAITAEEGSEILSENQPELQNLAYTIRHTVRQGDGSYNRYDESYLGSVKFRATREGVVGVKKSLQGNESILRFIVLETPEEDTRIGEKLPDEEAEEAAEAEAEAVKAAENKKDGEDKKEETEDGLAENSDESGKGDDNDDKK